MFGVPSDIYIEEILSEPTAHSPLKYISQPGARLGGIKEYRFERYLSSFIGNLVSFFYPEDKDTVFLILDSLFIVLERKAIKSHLENKRNLVDKLPVVSSIEEGVTLFSNKKSYTEDEFLHAIDFLSKIESGELRTMIGFAVNRIGKFLVNDNIEDENEMLEDLEIMKCMISKVSRVGYRLLLQDYTSFIVWVKEMEAVFNLHSLELSLSETDVFSWLWDVWNNSKHSVLGRTKAIMEWADEINSLECGVN